MLRQAKSKEETITINSVFFLVKNTGHWQLATTTYPPCYVELDLSCFLLAFWISRGTGRVSVTQKKRVDTRKLAYVNFNYFINRN